MNNEQPELTSKLLPMSSIFWQAEGITLTRFPIGLNPSRAHGEINTTIMDLIQGARHVNLLWQMDKASGKGARGCTKEQRESREGAEREQRGSRGSIEGV